MIKFIREEESVLRSAIHTYGSQLQRLVAIEEMSELTKELCKYDRGDESNISEEMADVYIMLEQLMIMFKNKNEVQEIAEKKIFRLQSRLEGAM